MIYDIAIIGAGPSSIGLIYGLLLPYDCADADADAADNDDHDGVTVGEVKYKQPNFTIALIERGTCTCTTVESLATAYDRHSHHSNSHSSDANADSDADAEISVNKPEEKKQKQKHTRTKCTTSSSSTFIHSTVTNVEDITDPKRWYRAAHPLSTYNNTNTRQRKRKQRRKCRLQSISISVAEEYHTTPQTNLGNRILPTPVGKGLGGGTNINACLVVRPNEDDFVDWPEKWTKSVHIDANGDGDGNRSRKRKMSRIMASVVQIEDEMRKNGAVEQESYHLSHQKYDDDDGGTIMSDNIGMCTRIEEEESSLSWRENRFEFQKYRMEEYQCNLNRSTNRRVYKNSDDEVSLKLCPVVNAAQKSRSSVDPNVSTTAPASAPAGTIQQYRRVNYYEAILKPLLDRNPQFQHILKIFTGVQAERLLFREDVDVDMDIDIGNGNDVEDKDMITAKGVECSYVREHEHDMEDNGEKDSKFFPILARTVILCAGAILSPALLQVSGIGNEEDLKAANIRLRSRNASPQSRSRSQNTCTGRDRANAKNHEGWKYVGKRLRDHLVAGKVFVSLRPLLNHSIGINSVRGWLALDILSSKLKMGHTSAEIDIVTGISTHPHGKGSKSDIKEGCTSTELQSRVLFKYLDGSSSPWIVPGIIASTFRRTYTFEPAWLCSVINKCLLGLSCALSFVLEIILNTSPFKWILMKHTYQVLVCLLNPDSMGSVKIRIHSDSATDRAISEKRLRYFDLEIDPSYLSNKRDMERMELSWKALDDISPKWLPRGFEILPGPLYKWMFRHGYLQKYLSDFTLPYFHHFGTCAMNYVVDDNLKVHRTTNIFVCDASIFTNPISCPPSLTLSALGLTAAQIVMRRCLSGKYE